eukprot:TRINITY_DN7018_c0_g1_i1.p1 TRINITY_DN7018_c0_g1~~TRINITY_DN7018_c0_g1_i1.p1  ORF type:complete len:434 (-),score=26.04 TRINITY_DN7018_c0_g1_i1:8-1225(-)
MDARFAACESHYDVLGVSQTASEEVIRRSFHAAALRLHPDKQKQKQPRDVCKDLSESTGISTVETADTSETSRDLLTHKNSRQSMCNKAGLATLRCDADDFPEDFSSETCFRTCDTCSRCGNSEDATSCQLEGSEPDKGSRNSIHDQTAQRMQEDPFRCQSDEENSSGTNPLVISCEADRLLDLGSTCRCSHYGSDDAGSRTKGDVLRGDDDSAEACCHEASHAANDCHHGRSHSRAHGEGTGTSGKLNVVDEARVETAANSSTNGNALDLYLRVREAWAILGDPVLREEYDRRLGVTSASEQSMFPRRSFSSSATPVAVILDGIDLDDMEAELDENGIETYTYPCRCGDVYNVYETDLLTARQVGEAGGSKAESVWEKPLHADKGPSLLVPCASCSLYIRVSLY